jgi:hypothetical protein
MKTRLQRCMSMGRMLLAVAVVAALAGGPVQPAVAATQIDIAGPAGSGAFGTSAAVLPNGNIVVTDPYYDAGAATWGDGRTGVVGLVSAANSLVGSTAEDAVGSDGGTELSNGNYVAWSSDRVDACSLLGTAV